jgi:hypothetical protein
MHAPGPNGLLNFLFTMDDEYPNAREAASYRENVSSHNVLNTGSSQKSTCTWAFTAQLILHPKIL